MADLVWENVAGDLDALTFDARLREVFTSTATVTEHAVESGATIADHVRLSPDRVSIEGYVSDSPASVPETHLGGVRGSVQSVDLDLGAQRVLKRASTNGQAATYGKKGEQQRARVLRFDEAPRRVPRVLDELRRLQRDRVLVSFFGIDVEVEDMIIASLAAPRELADGESCTFRLELVAIRFATSAIVEVPDPEEPRGNRTVDTGATTATESEEPESLWHSVFGL